MSLGLETDGGILVEKRGIVLTCILRQSFYECKQLLEFCLKLYFFCFFFSLSSFSLFTLSHYSLCSFLSLFTLFLSPISVLPSHLFNYVSITLYNSAFLNYHSLTSDILLSVHLSVNVFVCPSFCPLSCPAVY